MALTIDWNTLIINVPKADTQLVQVSPTEIRQLDLNAFRLELKDIEDSPEGMAYLATHSHNTAVDIGGVTLARVVSVINGYTVTFEDGQYAVNLIGANSNVGDVINVNQVSIRSANSAGLTFSEQINDQSFLGKVWVDTVQGLSGTAFPRGTPTDPTLTFDEGMTVALGRKLKAFNVSGLVTPTVSLARYALEGNSPEIATVILTGVPDTTAAVFNRLNVSGTINGACAFHDCIIDIVGGFEGSAYDTSIKQEIVIHPTCLDTIRFVNCHSDIPGLERPNLDFNGAGCDASLRNYAGGLKITNVSQAIKVSIDCNSATIELDATCTSGTFNIRGIGYLIDNSGPGCTVATEGLIEPGDVRLARDNARAANLQTQQP